MGWRLGVSERIEQESESRFGCICDYHLAVTFDQVSEEWGIGWPFPWMRHPCQRRETP